jgi:hypothetical protein
VDGLIAILDGKSASLASGDPGTAARAKAILAG